MNLSVKNIGKISHADIAINGITVLAGLNGTGKTSVCRALYTALSSFADIDQNVEAQRINSINGIFLGLQHDAFELEVTGVRQRVINYIRKKTTSEIDTAYIRRIISNGGLVLDNELIDSVIDRIKEVKVRDKQVYIEFIAMQNMSRAFHGQMGYLGTANQSVITVSNDKAAITIKTSGKNVSLASCTMLDVEKPLYVETASVLDAAQAYNARLSANSSSIYQFLVPDTQQDESTTLEEFEAYKANRDAMDDLLKDVTHGRLEVDEQSGSFVYREDGINEPINVHNVASGLKLFLMLQRFVENGTLNSKRVLIIDEPEVSLHPEWQIKLAKVLGVAKPRACFGFDAQANGGAHSFEHTQLFFLACY